LAVFVEPLNLPFAKDALLVYDLLENLLFVIKRLFGSNHTDPTLLPDQSCVLLATLLHILPWEDNVE
jgi:hypothetical protein